MKYPVRDVSPGRARAERLITVLLVVLLAAGLLGLAAAGHRRLVAAQARQRTLAARRALLDTEAEDAPTDEAPAVKRDAQGDQSSDE